MCCLFGLIDYGKNFSGRQRARLLSILGTECEARGTDATGLAYNSGGRLRVYKRPLPAHRMRFTLPNDAAVLMGHTRMTTQGSERYNYNNHPFRGLAGGLPFALAHNGVLHNDDSLRKALGLPRTGIETDSFVAVQLIESKGALSFDSLRYMAEKVEGSFTFTVLDQRDSLYIVKGDNPLCLYHFQRMGLYLYASTEAILARALKKMRMKVEKPVQVNVRQGDILRIDRGGMVTAERFDDGFYCQDWPTGLHSRPYQGRMSAYEMEYLRELKSVAASFGYPPEAIDRILLHGYSLDDVESLLYCGEV